MKVSTFFKILNKKIERYDKMASNPFTNPQPVLIVWVEDVTEKNKPEENDK